VLWLVPDGIVGAFERRLRKPPVRPATPDDAGVASFLGVDAGTARGLDVEGLGIAFGGTQAVRDVSLAAKAGEVTSIIGPNGAGKTTLLNLIGGFYPRDRGAVRLGLQALPNGVTYRVARAGVARTIQTTQLFARQSVLENVLIAMGRG
jgi:branched-chain amino acid transport system permease protein